MRTYVVVHTDVHTLLHTQLELVIDAAGAVKTGVQVLRGVGARCPASAVHPQGVGLGGQLGSPTLRHECCIAC